MAPPSEPGKDFGNPHYGMNTFDFVMLQLKAPLKACVSASDSQGNSTGKVCQ